MYWLEEMRIGRGGGDSSCHITSGKVDGENEQIQYSHMTDDNDIHVSKSKGFLCDMFTYSYL